MQRTHFCQFNPFVYRDTYQVPAEHQEKQESAQPNHGIPQEQNLSHLYRVRAKKAGYVVDKTVWPLMISVHT